MIIEIERKAIVFHLFFSTNDNKLDSIQDIYLFTFKLLS